MKLTETFLALSCLAALFACAQTQEHSAMAAPAESPSTEQHAWLLQLVGEWETEAEMPAGPGEEPMKMKGRESVRALGGLWIVADMRGESPMGVMEAVLTIGYDEAKQRYVGTWVDSMMNHLWRYEGSLDATGKILSLETEGPSFSGDGSMAKYKDVYELKSHDHKVLTSWMQGSDGVWTEFMTADYRRVK